MFDVTYSISGQQVADQIITAVEGGSGYWINSFKLVKGTHTESPWYSDPKLYEGDFEIEVLGHEDDESWTLTRQMVIDNIKLVTPAIITEIVSEEGDADTADVFLQVLLFQEIVYG